MWIIRATELSEGTLQHARDTLPAAHFKMLRERSSSVYVLGAGREPRLVLGILPPTFLSDVAYIWAMFFTDARFSLAELRKLREIMDWWIAEEPYKFVAEVDPQNKTNVKFLKFFGFQKLQSQGAHDLYGRAE